MLEINHHERKDFSQHPDKIGKVINSSIINCAKACIPRGRVKRYKCFWTDEFETLKNQGGHVLNTLVKFQAWRRQAAILRREITEPKRKSFKNFISHINYQKESQKTYKYLAKIQNNTPCSNKAPIHDNNDVITRYREKLIYLHVPSHEHRRRARMLGENRRQLKESIKPLNKKKMEVQNS